ncbi:MAG: xanthine dehydrogenase family protein molybdopterin-binding subunit [Sulfitobacter sp.]
MKFGTAQARDEDAMLVRGEGCYAGDRNPKGTLWMHVLRSDFAAGRITAVDTLNAETMPGVKLVLTGKAIKNAGIKPFPVRFIPPGQTIDAPPVWPLAQTHVRYAGEPIAAVIAETQAQAMDAAEAVIIEIEETAAVIDPEAADAQDAPTIWPEGNRIFTLDQGDYAAYQDAREQAAHVINAQIDISRVTAVSMEPRNALATPENGKLSLHTGTQAPHRVRAEMAHVLDIPEESLIVRSRDVGGSFGMRNGAYPEDALLLLAAKTLNVPIRWTATRGEGFLSDTHSRPQSLDVTLTLDNDLRFTALHVDGYAPVGAYVGPMSMHPMTGCLPGLAGMYKTPVIALRMRGMHVNTMHMAPYRGAGRPEAIFVMERMVDIAAHRLGVDRLDLRRRNLIAQNALPHTTPLGYTYDSGDFAAALNVALKAADADGFDARRQKAAKRGRLRGLGIACAIESAGAAFGPDQLPEFGGLRITPDGTLTLSAGSGDAGQGHKTAFAQIANHLLGWDGPVKIEAGDTARVSKGMGTFGSRTMGAVGSSLAIAADQIIAQALPHAADWLEVSATDIQFENGSFVVAGTDLSVSLQNLSRETGCSFNADAFASAPAGTFPNGVHIAEVEIDPDTGALDLIAYTVADDVGQIINPLLMEGQIHGGIAQGIGQAFVEHITYDEDGNLLSGSLMDYALPRANDLVNFAIHHAPTETQANPLGVKGVGESGTVGGLSVGINAVVDALAPLGIENITMPATPYRIWAAIQSAQAAKLARPAIGLK